MSNPGPVKCPHCGRRFVSHAAARQHRLVKHHDLYALTPEAVERAQQARDERRARAEHQRRIRGAELTHNQPKQEEFAVLVDQKLESETTRVAVCAFFHE